MKKLDRQELSEEERAVHASDLSERLMLVKNGSSLLKVWLSLWAIFFITMIVMALCAIF